jgi:hypothetical protein
MIPLSAVLEALHRLYVGATDASLRKEDRKKAAEIAGILAEVERLVASNSNRPITLVDAAAGKAYVGLLAAEFILAPASRTSRVILIERDAGQE